MRRLSIDLNVHNYTVFSSVIIRFLESRLPIKVQFVAAAEQAYKNTVTHRYTQPKQNAKDVEFKPALWDYGTEAAQDNLKADVAQLRTVEGTVTPIVTITE